MAQAHILLCYTSIARAHFQLFQPISGQALYVTGLLSQLHLVCSLASRPYSMAASTDIAAAWTWE